MGGVTSAALKQSAWGVTGSNVYDYKKDNLERKSMIASRNHKNKRNEQHTST